MQNFSTSAAAQELRQQAEAKIAAQVEEEVEHLTREEIRRLLYELRVSHVELEMQNDELRRTQELLLESRARYFDLYDLAPVGYLTLDHKNRILEANLAIATMLGTTRQVLRSHPFTHHIPIEDQDRFYLYRKHLVEAGEAQQFELRLRREIGTIFWARLDATLAFDEESNQPRFLLTVIDIEESKRQAEAMKLNTIIVNKASDAIFTTTAAPDYLITSWNRGAEAIYGWSADEAVGQPARMLRNEYPGCDAEAVHRGIAATGQFTGEVVQTTKDDDKVHVDCRVVALTDDRGSITGWINVNRDVTEKKRAEAALQRSQQNLAQAQRIGHMGSWDWDVEHSTLFWSDELYHIFGVAADFPLTYASIEAMIYPDDRAMNSAKVQEVLDKGRPIDFQFRIVRPDGAIRHIEQHIIADSAESGTPRRLIGIMQDITERKRADEEREALRARLGEAERLEMVGRLAGGIAHDFNNMLAVILVRAEMGEQMTMPHDSSHHHFAEIGRTAKRSASLVRQLLGYAGKQIIAPRSLDLTATTQGMLMLLRDLLGEDVELSFHGASDLWPVYIDPSQVDQLLVNLCINARDAISGTGRVIISMSNVETEHEIWSTGSVITPGDYVLLSVTDDGRGMANDVLEHIFEPFFTTKPVGKGTGLGLATVYGIVKQNHGEIQVYSEPGIGSTFNIYLPRFWPEGASSPQNARKAIPMGNGERILLVEDKSELLRSTADALRHLGYSVTECTAPPEAERLVADGVLHPDLLVTDVVMPQMNGYELASRVAALRPGIKYLFVSGYPAEAIADRLIPFDGSHFLQKPFSLGALAAKIKAVLEG